MALSLRLLTISLQFVSQLGLADKPMIFGQGKTLAVPDFHNRAVETQSVMLEQIILKEGGGRGGKGGGGRGGDPHHPCRSL